MPRTLVTHLHPHLDDIAGFWLLKRFDPSLRKARMIYMPTSAGGIKLEAGRIGVGVGRGKYDEHKGDKKDSATSLVWKDLKRRGLLPGGRTGKALADLVDFVRRGDMGQFIGQPGDFLKYNAVLQTLSGLPGETSLSATLTGFKLLDAMWNVFEQRVMLREAERRGIRFPAKWGRGIGLVTEAIPTAVSSYAVERGYAVVVLQHPSKAYLHVRAAPKSKADLTALAKVVRAAEPDSEWYLHHSKKMFLHGDLVAPTRKRTKYSVGAIIALIRRLYGA